MRNDIFNNGFVFGILILMSYSIITVIIMRSYRSMTVGNTNVNNVSIVIFNLTSVPHSILMFHGE